MALDILRVIAFDGGYNLPVWAGRRHGFFEAQGLQVDLGFTPTSGFLVTSLMQGSADIGLAGFDNIVAYQAGQGEAALPADPDLFAFMGGDGGLLTLMAASPAGDVGQLRGRELAVDAMTTGFAFVLRELLAQGGVAGHEVAFVKAGGTASRYADLVAGKHAATLLRTPYELRAAAAGFRPLATARQALGSYQGTVGAARRAWAASHEDELLRFLKGYRAALDWTASPAHRDEAAALLVEHSPGLPAALAQQALDLLLESDGGLSRDLALDARGMATVLRLRSKYGTPARQLDDAGPFIDTRYLARAFAA